MLAKPIAVIGIIMTNAIKTFSLAAILAATTLAYSDHISVLDDLIQ
jgi:hypothetical protein